MAQVEAVTERIITADPERVFDALADYSSTRQKLLPEHFSEYEVREGGDGEGTVVHWKLQATSKRVRDCLLDVTEPSEGELVEKDRNSTMVTTWRVTPGGEGASRVVVTSVWNGATGIGGFFERTFAPKGLGRIYDAVLAQLAAETEGAASADQGAAAAEAGAAKPAGADAAGAEGASEGTPAEPSKPSEGRTNG
ncbi:SRPBCC family protein [Streptomyces tsukubensis]|nr:SRPBCC family protein [Streptomyces tsukubensis]